MAYTCNINTIEEKFKKSLSSVSKVQETLLTLLKEGATIEDIVQVVTAPISSRILRTLNPDVKKFISDKQQILDFLSSKQSSDAPNLPETTKTEIKEAEIDNPDEIIQNGKRSKTWIHDAWGIASLSQVKFIERTNREINDRVISLVCRTGKTEDPEIVLNAAIKNYFTYNLNQLKEFFTRNGKEDYAKIIEDNMPFEAGENNPNQKIKTIINNISDYFSQVSDQEKIAYTQSTNSSNDIAVAFSRFLLIQPLNFDNFIKSYYNSINIKNIGKLSPSINKYSLQLGKGRQNQSWQDENSVYKIAKMVDSVVQNEIATWPIYRKVNGIWTKQTDEYCSTNRVVGITSKILNIANLKNTKDFPPLQYNELTSNFIDDLKNTFRTAFGVNLQTGEDVIEEVFRKYIENKTLPEIVSSVQMDMNHLFPIVMYLLTKENGSSKKSISETNFKSGVVKFENNEVEIIHSIWHNMIDPLKSDSLFNNPSDNSFDVYQMIMQVFCTHERKTLYGIINDMGVVDKKYYSIGKANQRLNYFQSKINGYYSPIIPRSIVNTTIENNFEGESPSTKIIFKVPGKSVNYTLKVEMGKLTEVLRNGKEIIPKESKSALEELNKFFEETIRLDFSSQDRGSLIDIYINKIGNSSKKALDNLLDIASGMIYANQVSQYLQRESTSDFKNNLRNFYREPPKLVRGVTYNQIDAFSGRLFPILSQLSIANDIHDGIIGDIVVKGGAGEQINSVILSTLLTKYAQFVQEKSQDPASAIKHFSLQKLLKQVTFFRDYVDKTGDVKSSTSMNVEEFFTNNFIYDFYGGTMATQFGVLSDKPNVVKNEYYIDGEIVVDVDKQPKKLKDCTAKDLRKIAVRELGIYYQRMKQEMDRNLSILSAYSPNGIKYDINTDYLETRGISKKDLEKDIHEAIYRAQQAGEDIEINELLYFSWEGDILHTKPSIIGELTKHDIPVADTFGLEVENSEQFFERKESELVANLLQDLSKGITFIDDQSQKTIDSSAVKAMIKANKVEGEEPGSKNNWITRRNVIIGKILFGDKYINLLTKRSLSDWGPYKYLHKYINDNSLQSKYDISKLDINSDFDFQYFIKVLNKLYPKIQEKQFFDKKLKELKTKLKNTLNKSTQKIDKKALVENYKQWRKQQFPEESITDFNGAVFDYETETDERKWRARDTAIKMEGIDSITSLKVIAAIASEYGLDIDTSFEKPESIKFSLKVNPELQRYNTLHYLFTEEGLNSTVGSHINHKAKYMRDLKLLGAVETGQQAKRNVSESGAKNQYTRGDIQGMNPYMTIANLKDLKASISTINGIEDHSGATPMDGSTFGNYVTRKEELYSLGSQKAGIENSKPLGNDLNAKTGTGTIIKTAVFVLTNGRIRSSERNIILHKHMNNIPWKAEFNGNFLEDFNGQEIKYHPIIVFKPSTGEYYLRYNLQIDSDGKTSFEELQINNNVLSINLGNGITIGSLIKSGKDITPYINTIASIIKPKVIGNKISTQITTTRPIRTNYELWDLFGGAYSASIDENNKLVYKNDNTSLENLTIACHSVGKKLTDNATRLTNQDVWLPLKEAKIDWVVTEGAIKQGVSNINATEMLDNMNFHVTTQKISTIDVGMQLNPEHLVDSSHLTLMTQVVNALGLRGFSADVANRCYQALASLTDFSLKELFEGIEADLKGEDSQKFKDAVSSLLLKSIVGTSETDGDLLASIVIQLNKQEKNGHDYDIIKHKLPISDPAILNKLISNFSSLMTKAGVRIQFPGSMNVLVPSDGLYRIHGGKLRTFASTQRYTDSKASNVLRNIIKTKGYALVWAHPGIGKSYSIEQGKFSDKIIDWDIEFNRIRDQWIAEHSNTKIGTQKFNKAKYEYLVNFQNYPDFVQFITENWNKVKQKTIQEKKILVASPHSLLKMFSNEFDEIIDLPQNIFVNRNMQRGGTEEDSISLKNDLDATIKSLDNPNIVSTNQYLEEILSDVFNSGNLIENNEAEVEQQRLQELQAQQQPLEGLHAITIGGSYFIKITNKQFNSDNPLLATVLAGKSIKIDDLSTYYQVRDLLKGAEYTITEDVIAGRELAPYNCTFNTDKGTFMLWDLDSIKHIHMIEQDDKNHSKMQEIFNNYTDEQIYQEFHISPSKLDRTNIETFVNTFKKLINRRRQIELNSIGSGNNNDAYINGERVIIDKSSLKKSPYELIAPKNYETTFGLRVGDDLQEIKNDNLFFLKRLIETYYKLENGVWADQTPIQSNQYDIILKTVSGKHYPILYKSENSKISEGLSKIEDDEFYNRISWEGNKVYWLDGNGEKLYELPYELDSNKKVVYKAEILTDEIGNEVIYTSDPKFFANKITFNNIDFGRHILDVPFITDIFKSLEGSKKKSIQRLFKEYSQNLIPIDVKGDPEKQMLQRVTNEDILKQQITEHFNSRNAVLTQLNKEILTGNITGEYTGVFGQMIKSSIETHTSFLKSLEYIVSRTPAQSHQSFMPMKLVAFDESGKNSAYVNRYQLYLQGSDYDVDKASLLGSIFRNGKYVVWSPFMNLMSYEHLKASETLPFPTGKKLTKVNIQKGETLNKRFYDVIDKPINIDWEEDHITFRLPNSQVEVTLNKIGDTQWQLDLTNEFLASLSSMEQYILERAIVDKLDEGDQLISQVDLSGVGISNGVKDSKTIDYIQDFLQFNDIFRDMDLETPEGIYQLGILLNAYNQFGTTIIGGTFATSDAEMLKNIANIVDEHNTFFEGNYSTDPKDAVVNYISSTMFQISSDPVNLIQAMTSVDQQTEVIKDIAKKSPLAKQSQHFDKGNIMSTFRLLRLTLSGKQDTGIEASSLKVMEAINQYQDYILNYGSDEEQKSLIKPINIGGYDIQMICNAYCKNIANIKSKEVYDALQEINNDEDQALWLSAFLSLSTDNAKDPTLSKINANPEMIGLYNAGFVLGLPIDFLTKVIMSSSGMALASLQQGNVFLGISGSRNLTRVLNYVDKGPQLNMNPMTLEILSKAIQLQYGESDITPNNLRYNLIPNIYSQSDLILARRIINVAKSLAYSDGNDNIEYNLPTLESRLSKELKHKSRILENTKKAIQATLAAIQEKENLGKKHKRLDDTLHKQTVQLEELEAQVSELKDIKAEYQISQSIPNKGDENSKYAEYARYQEQLASLSEGDYVGLLKGIQSYQSYIKESANFKKVISDLEAYLDVVEQIQFDEGFEGLDGQHYNSLPIIKQLNQFAHEMSLIRPNLGLNQQLPNSKEKQINFVKKFENAIYDRLNNINTREQEKDTPELQALADLNEILGKNKYAVDITKFIWDEIYRNTAISAYESIKYKVNILDVLMKVPHYFGYLKACGALYKSLQNVSLQYREQDRIADTIIRGELKVSNSKDIQKRLKSASRYISRLMNNMFLTQQNVELTIPKIKDNNVDNNTKVTIQLGTIEGNKAFKEWMDLVVIPKYKQRYISNRFFKELNQTPYHKTDNHNTSINYTTGIDIMSSDHSEITKVAEVTESFNRLASKDNINGLPMIDAFFYYDLIAYDRQPGQQALTPIFNQLAALGKTEVLNNYIAFISDLDQNGMYILSLDPQQKDEIKRFIAPTISIYALDNFKEPYAWVKDPKDSQIYLIQKQETEQGEINEDMMDYDEDTLDLDEVTNIDGLENEFEDNAPLTLESKLRDMGNTYEIVSSVDLNNPYMQDFTLLEEQSILEGQALISQDQLKIGNSIITLDDNGNPVLDDNIRKKLKSITGQKNVDDLVVSKTVIQGNTPIKVIDIETTKANLENPCK